MDRLHTPSLRHLPAYGLAFALLAVFALGAWKAAAQHRLAPNSMPVAIPSNPVRPSNPYAAYSHTAPEASAGPGWHELTTPQKLALYPLAERWSRMSHTQKHRWLTLAQTFSILPETEQDRLHERMTAWANLSGQQRNQARLNFSILHKLDPDEKRAQWEAYQALSEQKKTELAAQAPPKATGAATAIHPAPPQKLVQVPAAISMQGNPVNPPKIPPAAKAAPRMAAPVASAASEASSGVVETRPVAPSAVVQTAPVSTPSAVSTPLAPLQAAQPDAAASQPDTPVVTPSQ